LSQKSNDSDENCYLLVSPNDVKEIRSEIVSLKICISDPKIGCHRCSKFSSWKSLVKALSFLRHFIQLWRSKHAGKQVCVAKDDPGFRKDTETFIILQIQCEGFEKEIENMKVQKPIQKDSVFFKLDPFIDSAGVLRVGGRLKHSNMSLGEKNHILIPGIHAIAKLLVSYYHELVKHQGRHITEGEVRSAGLWITGLNRLVYSVISKCVLCRRFRVNVTTQEMSD
jgi:hypothetical protein